MKNILIAAALALVASVPFAVQAAPSDSSYGGERGMQVANASESTASMDTIESTMYGMIALVNSDFANGAATLDEYRKVQFLLKKIDLNDSGLVGTFRAHYGVYNSEMANPTAALFNTLLGFAAIENALQN